MNLPRFLRPALRGAPMGKPLLVAGPFSTAPPTPGTMEAGEILVDAQSRTMWLGVSADVDPAEALLLSDIVALQAADAQTLVDAKAYTVALLKGDSGLPINPKGYSGRDHLHTSAQITDFDDAVNDAVIAGPAASFTRGMIIMWSGAPTDIGVGALASWALCQGQSISGPWGSKLPDLRDRFIIGSGNKAIHAKNTPTSIKTGLDGGHSHKAVTGGTAITIANLPSHTHGVTDPTHGHTLSDPGHSHTYAAPLTGQAGAAPGGYVQTTVQNVNTSQVVTGASILANDTGITIKNTGSGTTHTHTISVEADHQHTIPALTESVPYYALAFIIKL